MLGFFSSLQGQQEQGTSPKASTPSGEAELSDTPRAEAGAFSFWQVASAISDSVKRSTAEIAASVTDTDWRAEITAFGQGVTQESQQFKDNAAAAVEHLPAQATRATSSLQQQFRAPEMQARLAKAGVNIEKFARKIAFSSSELFEDVKEAILSELGPRGATAPAKLNRSGSQSSKFNRLEADIAAMQRNSATYCEEPEPGAAYDHWLADFDLESQADEIHAITQENAFMSELQTRIVPLIVSREMFWTRYFYRLHLVKAEHARHHKLRQQTASSQEEKDIWKDDAPRQELAVQSPESAAPAGTFASTHHLPTSASAEVGSHHSRAPSKATTEADPDDADTEESGKSNEESSGSEAWSVISNPGTSLQHAAASAASAITASTETDSQASAQASQTPPPESSVIHLTDHKIKKQAPGSNEQHESEADAAVAPTAGAQTAGKATAQNKAESDADDLSELSGSAAEGSMSEGEEDWGTWE